MRAGSASAPSLQWVSRQRASASTISHLGLASWEALLEIELPQVFRTSIVALRIMRDAVCCKQITEVEPKPGLRVVCVAVLEALDVSNGLSLVNKILELSQSNSDCRKIVGWHNLSCGQLGNAAGRHASCCDDECERLLPSHGDVS